MLIMYLFFIIVSLVVYGFVAFVSSIAYKVKINRLLDNIHTKEDLLYMNTKDFENVIAEMFRRKGNKVKLSDRFADGGNGIILNDIQYVQVKKYPYHHLIEIEHAKKLSRFMQIESIYRGKIITLGDFKENTKKYCHKSVIECINGDRLLTMCQEVHGANLSLARLLQ